MLPQGRSFLFIAELLWVYFPSGIRAPWCFSDVDVVTPGTLNLVRHTFSTARPYALCPTHRAIFALTLPRFWTDQTSGAISRVARVEKWLTANKLTLNASKTEFMLIGSRQRLSTFHNPPSLMINGAPITRVTSTKSLGVHIDQTLSWNVHVENLCKKIASGIGALKRVRSFVPHETLRSIFMSLV